VSLDEAEYVAQEKQKDGKVMGPEISRREALKQATRAGALTLAGFATVPADAAKTNRIRDENARPGTRDWLLTHTRVDPAMKYRCRWIEGYCSHTSALAGETVRFFVSTNPPSGFTLDLYRLGYYGGTGGRLMRRLGSFEGRTQPDPEIGPKRLRNCRWEPCAELRIGTDWLSSTSAS
jgi:hypothetical protein